MVLEQGLPFCFEMSLEQNIGSILRLIGVVKTWEEERQVGKDWILKATDNQGSETQLFDD